MTTNTRTAYVVNLTLDEIQSLASIVRNHADNVRPIPVAARWKGIAESVRHATPLDIDALRLVLEEANETVWQAKYGKGTIESWALLQSAISKIEPLTK